MKVFGPMTEQWSEILCIIIVATITIANLFAIRQNNLKRFMAFSSISQAGYIMLAVLAGTPQGMASLVYYIVVYIAANLAVFGVINTIEQHTHGKIEREDYNGLYKTNPKLTMVMTLSFLIAWVSRHLPDSSVSSLYSWQHSIVDIILLYLSHWSIQSFHCIITY